MFKEIVQIEWSIFFIKDKEEFSHFSPSLTHLSFLKGFQSKRIMIRKCLLRCEKTLHSNMLRI